MKNALRLFWGMLLLAGVVVPESAAQVYSGQGRAVMGSSMTPSGTRALAFEKARQSALETFGAQVLSRQSVSTIETPQGIEEISKSKIVVLAAGETHLVEGSKTVTRKMTESAILYRVTAKFRIEPNAITKTLKAYLQTGQDAPLRSSVNDAVQLQRRLKEVGPEVDGKKVRQLVSRTQDVYEQITAATENFDGAAARSKISRQRRRRLNALLRYLNAVRHHGYPGDLVDLHLSGPSMQDEGELVTLTYKIGYSFSGSGTLASACRESRPVWADRPAHQRTDDPPSLDGWFEKVFPQGEDGFQVAKTLLIFLVDQDGRVVALSNPGGVFEFKYARCSTEQFLEVNLLNWQRMEKDIHLPTSDLASVDRAVIALATRKYERIAQRNGYAGLDRGLGLYDLYVRRSGPGVPVGRFAYSREEFNSFVDTYATTVKKMNPFP